MPVRETVEALLMLLPGFLSAAIVREFTVKEELSVFERLVQALILTFVVQAIWQTPLLLFGVEPGVGAQIVGLAVTAVALGFLVTWALNNSIIHDLLNEWGISKSLALRNPWYSAFYRTEGHFVVLHLKDGRRVFGWPRMYPDMASYGHIFLEDAEWLGDEPSAEKDMTTNLLIDVGDIQFVEFVAMKPQ